MRRLRRPIFFQSMAIAALVMTWTMGDVSQRRSKENAQAATAFAQALASTHVQLSGLLWDISRDRAIGQNVDWGLSTSIKRALDGRLRKGELDYLQLSDGCKPLAKFASIVLNSDPCTRLPSDRKPESSSFLWDLDQGKPPVLFAIIPSQFSARSQQFTLIGGVELSPEWMHLNNLDRWLSAGYELKPLSQSSDAGWSSGPLTPDLQLVRFDTWAWLLPYPTDNPAGVLRVFWVLSLALLIGASLIQAARGLRAEQIIDVLDDQKSTLLRQSKDQEREIKSLTNAAKLVEQDLQQYRRTIAALNRQLAEASVKALQRGLSADPQTETDPTPRPATLSAMLSEAERLVSTRNCEHVVSFNSEATVLPFAHKNLQVNPNRVTASLYHALEAMVETIVDECASDRSLWSHPDVAISVKGRQSGPKTFVLLNAVVTDRPQTYFTLTDDSEHLRIAKTLAQEQHLSLQLLPPIAGAISVVLSWDVSLFENDLSHEKTRATSALTQKSPVSTYLE